MPAFGDARASALLAKAAAAGLKPKSDTELLPVLLELTGSNIPVNKWPTQLKCLFRARGPGSCDAGHGETVTGCCRGQLRLSTA